MAFQSYDIHAGTDMTGVPTKMLSINSTVRIAFRNPATFFGVHVSSTPFQLYFSDLKIATGLVSTITPFLPLGLSFSIPHFGVPPIAIFHVVRAS